MNQVISNSGCVCDNSKVCSKWLFGLEKCLFFIFFNLLHQILLYKPEDYGKNWSNREFKIQPQWQIQYFFGSETHKLSSNSYT